jgi:hypothetical protein
MDASKLSGGSFYTSNPDKVLGEKTKAKSKFGQEVTIVTGSTDIALSKIDADETRIVIPDADDMPTTSVVKPKKDKPSTDKENNVEKALKKSKEDVAAKAKRKAEIESSAEDTLPKKPDIYTFEETYNYLKNGTSWLSLEPIMLTVKLIQKIGLTMDTCITIKVN